MKHILFVCIHNSGRSQMARAFMERLAQGTVTAESAGTIPSEQVNPVVVEAMGERDIHIGNTKPKFLTPEMIERADRVITMGCSVEDACPGTRFERSAMRLRQGSGAF